MKGINMKELKHTNLKEKYASLEPNNADQYDNKDLSEECIKKCKKFFKEIEIKNVTRKEQK